MRLLWVLRDHLGMTGTKFGCGMALCGACTVHVDDSDSRLSCQSRRWPARKSHHPGYRRDGARRGVAAAWVALNVPQCSCPKQGTDNVRRRTLASSSQPTDLDIDAAMAGNICRCGTYPRIRAAIKRAAMRMPKLDLVEGAK
jgi:isoquinoline 1-oxidoreductase alpha subunit